MHRFQPQQKARKSAVRSGLSRRLCAASDRISRSLMSGLHRITVSQFIGRRQNDRYTCRQAVYNFNRILEQIAGLYRAPHGMAVLYAEYKLLFSALANCFIWYNRSIVSMVCEYGRLLGIAGGADFRLSRSNQAAPQRLLRHLRLSD